MIIFEEAASQVTDVAGPVVKVFVVAGVTLPTGPIAIVHILVNCIAGLAFSRSLAPPAATNDARFALAIFDEFSLIGVTELTLNNGNIPIRGF